MESSTYFDKEINYMGNSLGRFKEVVINDHEARLYNPDLEKVIEFITLYEGLDDCLYFDCYQYQVEEKPNHYYHNGIMAWDLIDQIMTYYGEDVDGAEGFYLGNIFKYLLRFKYKDQAQSDLEKVKVYVDRIMEIYGSLS